MNGLALRISNAGAKKNKHSCAFAKLDVSKYFSQNVVASNEPFSSFFNAATADEQLIALKPLLELEASLHETNGECNIQSIQFLVKIFFYAEAKHPVKCFLARYITKNKFIQLQFSTILSEEIKTTISNEISTYREYIDVLTNVSSCIENFPSGSLAVKNLEVELSKYLDSCLRCCVDTLRTSQSLPPTEKNEIYNLAHLALRIFLYIVQKISPENVDQMTSAFTTIRTSIHSLSFDEDAPMDTKSVCGMLYLNMHLLEKGQDSWVDILHCDTQDPDVKSLLSHEASQLALFSAIATVIPVDKLQTLTVEGEAAIIILCKKILAIGERSCSESIFILGVTRTLVQISKQLEKCSISSLGLALVANLLNFVWAHLEHYMDSVRHLTAQVLGNIVKYCSRLEKEGESGPLSALFEALTTHLDVNRKSYYVSLTALVSELGAAGVLSRRAAAVCDAIAALSAHHTQASATTTLEALLLRHVKETDTETIYQSWVEPILEHVHSNNLHSSVLAVLQGLLTKAVQLDNQLYYYILPHIRHATTDLKCVLMLLSVARKSGVASKVEDEDLEWKGLISYRVLDQAAIDAVDETRILSLSLIAESPKTTEVFTQGELNFILTFLKYNINAQSPNFRQLMLSLLKKFIKRLEDSYKIYKKQFATNEDYYIKKFEELRSLCFDSLLQGANYSRRLVALQTLVWCEHLHLDGYEKIWIEEYVDKLLLHLEDSYENNKAFALEILNKCPSSLITSKKYSTSIELEDILRQASSLKPTDCVSAAYKLDLLITKVPENILAHSNSNSSIPSEVMFVLLQRLHSALLVELERCSVSIVNACSDAPMYGLLHCMVHLVSTVDADAISVSSEWSSLVGDIIATCVRVNTAVACVVNSASPEGHLPSDMGPASASGVRLQDGRQVTAQMVLLCAWRSVKEVSLLLGEISSRLSIVGESPIGTLTPEQMISIGEHFTKLLAETKHRGAFEQAYVGFTKLLARLWRCRSDRLHSLPRGWLAGLTAAVQGGGGGGALGTTRRGAGLPFLIQALVTTEIQVQGNPKCFHKCMTTLLRLARSSPSEEHQSETAIETRTHSINILRALFRNSALDESVSSYVGEGLIVALNGFEGKTWMERNSSTLLFSALMVRVFGVQRGKDSDQLSVRNRMTGRIFFLRYPALYDYMLNKLQEVSSVEAGNLRPGLYPVLLLLARLYPSSLEGTVSNLKLAAYVPLVWGCARSGALLARRLAARALPALLAPARYIEHLESAFNLICDTTIQKNYCHGILLQITRLLDVKSKVMKEELNSNTLQHHLYNISDEETAVRIAGAIRRSYWVLEQATGKQPCYLLADEYLNIINNIVWRFPNLITKDMSEHIQLQLEILLFNENPSPITSGKEVCLSHALYLYYILIHKYGVQKTCELMFRSLSHPLYEVVLTTLNLILIWHQNLEIENKFEEHLDEIFNDAPREESKSTEFIETLNEFVQILCQILNTNKYLECQQKTLKVLSLIKNTERYIVQTRIKKKGIKITNEITIDTLINYINMEHENIVHIYLECLSNFVSKVAEESVAVKPILMLKVIRAMFACSRAYNTQETRAVVVGFFENSYEEMFMLGLDGLSKEAKFEYKATVYATLVTLLEDDDTTLRQRISNIIMKLQILFRYNMHNFEDDDSNVTSQDEGYPKVVASKAAKVLREIIAVDNFPVLTVLALLDFKSEVCMNNDVDDECRVFDQNERFNIYLEETMWTKEIAEIIKEVRTGDVFEYILDIIRDDSYKKTFIKLCNENLLIFHKIVNNDLDVNTSVNPKVELFINSLKNIVKPVEDDIAPKRKKRFYKSKASRKCCTTYPA